MASPVLIKDRYEIKDVLGRGGMGVVFKAFDVLMRREVAVKTLRDVASSVFVDLFYRECSVLTAMVHPNIVEIFDMGEFEEDGVMKPYFVMPLLPGRTLYDLIYPSGRPLPVERCTDIISQACRGLHAAHECGLLHRDIKPRNIFVMRDDAVKLIDFGVVRLLGQQTIGAPGTLGTLHYMAPEQISMKPLTVRSDIFSLATVCYEALTGVNPFIGTNESETAVAVAEHTPALVSALNPLVNRPLAQAIAQAMAKDPRNRFESAAAFADALQRGLRNERPGASLLTNPENRLARAQRSFARGDYEFTQEIVKQLEEEGADGPDVQKLRLQLAEAVRKQQAEVHLTTARRYFAEEEYGLAMRRVMEVLEVHPAQQDALSLKTEIQDKLNELHVTDALARAAAHLDVGEFSEGRRLIADSLDLQPQNAEAQRLLAEADRRAHDWPRQKQQQEELFQSAQGAYFEGRFDTALRNLEQLADLTSGNKAAGARVIEYKDFYKRVQGDYDALQAMLSDARKLLGNGELESALKLSERLREQCPQDPDVRAFSVDVAARRDAREQEYRRSIANSLASEPDLSARLHILNQALRSRPTDEYFHEERQKLQTQLQKVTELLQRAQVFEASGRFEYAIEEWLCVGDTYPAYPGLQDQLARVHEAWREAREKNKTELGLAVKQAIKQGQQDHAAALLAAVQAEFQGDADYTQLTALVQSSGQAHKEAAVLLNRIRKAESERRFGDIPTLSQAVAAVSEHIDPLREKTLDTLIATASRLVTSNWRVANEVAQEAARIGTVPEAIHRSIALQRREEDVTGILGEERSAHTNLDAYRERVAVMLDQYPGEARLEDRLRLIDVALVDKRKQDERRGCVAELALMSQELGAANDHRRLWDAYIQAKNLAAPFAEDPEVAANLEIIREQGSHFEEAADALTRDRIQDSFAICDGMLQRHPGHVLFQKLRDQTTARHLQLGEDYLARVERWLASEPDVYQRELILNKAQEEYPFETRYAEELRHLQREKALADALAAKARDLEKRGQTAEALGQWRQLRNLHSTYPNLQEEIGRCEAILDRAQRKLRAQRLLTQGETHLAEGHYAEGYQMVQEAAETSQEIPDLLRHAAPALVAGARAAIPVNPKLSEAMLHLAQTIDEGLRVPKEMRAKIAEARKAEDLAACLNGIQTSQASGDLTGAVALAESFLGTFPGVKQVESARSKLLVEIERERRQQERDRALDQFREMELQAAGMGPDELLNLKESVKEVARLNPAEPEIRQRAATLDSLFGSLAEVRSHLEAHDPEKAHEACTRAFANFPDHPLFKAARAEASKQKDAALAQEIEQIKRAAELEKDFKKQAEVLRQALERFPNDPSLQDQLVSVNAKQSELEARIEKARELETKRLFGEAIKEWEAIGQEYPTVPDVGAEVERLTSARLKDKQDSLERWFRQVEVAVEGGDYETAGTMLRQAAQQQPDRKLQGLNLLLQEGLRKKRESDVKFTAGSDLLAAGNLTEGGNVLFRAFELQPKDKEKTNAIVLLLLGQIRAHMGSDLASCESLLSLVNRIRPGKALPPDIADVFARKQQSAAAQNVSVQNPSSQNANTSEGLAQVADFVKQVETARSARSLSAVSKKLHASKLLDSRDVEVRRTAGELLRKINSRLSGMEPQLKGKKREPAQPDKTFSAGSIAAAVILLLCFGGVAFFLSRPPKRESGSVPVLLIVTPDHTNVEMEGHSCVTPDCQLSLKPGEYLVKLRKEGYLPKDIIVPVKGTDKAPLNVTAELEPLVGARESEVARTALAKIQIRGARPGTHVRLDATDVGEVSLQGTLSVDVPPGMHTLDLSLDGFSNRTIKRNFVRGELVSLANEEVQLQPSQPNVRR